MSDDTFHPRVLVVDDELGEPTTFGRAAGALVDALRACGCDVVEARSAWAGLEAARVDPAVDAVLVDWRLGEAGQSPSGTLSILTDVRARDGRVPIFLTAERADVSAIPIEAMQLADEFVWMLEDTPSFLAGRVRAAACRFRRRVERPNAAVRRCVLVVHPALASSEPHESADVRRLCAALAASGARVIEACTFEDGHAALISDAHIHAVVIDAALTGQRGASGGAGDLLRAVRERNARLPAFVAGDREITFTGADDGHSYLTHWASAACAEHVTAALERYLAELLPPFSRALLAYDREREQSWAAPGHQGGVAFTKSPVGRVFFDYYGEALFRSDMGIERTELGSLLDHSGPIGESERYAARVFGAHRTYSVLNGSSGANRAILAACVGDGEVAVIDRNCHKSIEQGLAMTGGVPVYVRPRRNRFGIIGPIARRDLEPGSIAAAIAGHPIASTARRQTPVYAVMTNCTYDGVCYDAESAEALLGQSADRVHFDEAWYAYARFHPLFEGRCAMRGEARDHRAPRPTVFATQSTHKLLAALSQAAFIHVRDGRRPIEHERFNEAYGLEASTSPFYPIIAANEIAAAMVDGAGGFVLTHDALREAIAFRQAIARLQAELSARGEWFFVPWNAPLVSDVGGRGTLPFHSAPEEWLTNNARCWTLEPNESWHGFGDVPDGWAMLDPTKVGIVCPGVRDDASLDANAIPADLVTAYLRARAIVPSRTTDHMVLFLFTIGVTKGKWGTLVNALLDFKADFDRNAAVAAVLPQIADAGGARYAGMGLRDLAREMVGHLHTHRQGHWQARACAELPRPVVTPRQAFQRLMAGDAELVPLARMADRVSGVGILPYPPGIPVIMPGENLGAADGPWLSYLTALQTWNARFPGFGKDVEGTELRDGEFHAYCLTDSAAIQA